MTTPFRNTIKTYLHPVFGGLVAGDIPAATPVVKGVISVGVAFWGTGYGPAPAATSGSLSLTLMLDGAELPAIVTGPPFSFQLDTTQLNDGTHTVSFCVKASTSAVQYSADQVRSLAQEFVVANHGQVSEGPQTIPVGGGWMHSVIDPPTPDIYNFPGTPLPSKSVPLAYVPVPSANGNIAMRDPSRWWVEPITSVRNGLYTSCPRVFTTQSGGAVVKMYNPEAQGGLPQSRPQLRMHQNADGGRNVNMVDPYSTIAAYPNQPGHWLAIEAPGRLSHIHPDGSVTVIAGFQKDTATLPYDFRDTTVPDNLLYARGSALPPNNHVCSPNDCPTDVCFDPRDPHIVYVCAYGSHAIVRIDITDEGNPLLSFYAGQDGHAGYAEGPALQALFNKPYSITMREDGTMIVADFQNHALRGITPDGQTVFTIAGGNLAGPVIAMNQMTVTLRDSYSSPGTVPIDGSTVPYPQCVRVLSTGDIAIWEGCTATVRQLNWGGNSLTRMAACEGVINQEAWAWLDVDVKGTCGPVDDIGLVISNAAALRLGNGTVPFAKTSIYRLPVENRANVLQMAANGGFGISDGENVYSQETSGHYPWVFAFSRTECRFVSMGYGHNGISGFRAKLPTDPSYLTYTKPYQQNWLNGLHIWKTGTVSSWPWGSRPAFSTLHGEYGHGYLGLANFDDLASMSDADLATFFSGGMEGGIARPEITGNDMRDLIYFARRMALQTGSLHPVKPGPSSPDVTPPVISGISSSRNGNSITVSWTTNEPAIGYVAFGVGTSYVHEWSPLESAYSTQHSVTFDVMDGQIHYVIVAKDVAGNVAKSQTLVV